MIFAEEEKGKRALLRREERGDFLFHECPRPLSLGERGGRLLGGGGGGGKESLCA